MTTHLTGMLVRGASFGPGGARAFSERAVSEKLFDFSMYVVNNPRKAGITQNVGNTAAPCVSHVRTYYEFRLNPPRRVGGSGVSDVKDGLGHALRRCLKGLRKLYPSDPNHRKKAAVLYSHMMRLKNLLNLRDPLDAMIWAFVCVAWQGDRRSGELVRKRTGAWNPHFGHAPRTRDVGLE